MFGPLPAQCLPHPFGNSRFFLMTITFYTLMIMFSQICCSICIKLCHKTCEQSYRHFGIYEKSPNGFLPGLSRSIINHLLSVYYKRNSFFYQFFLYIKGSSIKQDCTVLSCHFFYDSSVSTQHNKSDIILGMNSHP